MRAKINSLHKTSFYDKQFSHLRWAERSMKMSNIYGRITALTSSSGGVKGRIEYISDPERQENIKCFYSTVDERVWEQLHQERILDNKSRGQYDNCIEAKEFTLAIPHMFSIADNTAELIAKDFEQKFKVPCAVAIHEKSAGKNIHAHIVFSESSLLAVPEIKRASRDMFYDENGKHVRTKKEILDENKELRPGCSIIKKGEIYKAKLFAAKDEKLRGKELAQELKEYYADKFELSLYSAKQLRLKQYKYGKGNPKEQKIKQYNKAVQQFNLIADKIIKSENEYCIDKLEQSVKNLRKYVDMDLTELGETVKDYQKYLVDAYEHRLIRQAEKASEAPKPKKEDWEIIRDNAWQNMQNGQIDWDEIRRDYAKQERENKLIFESDEIDIGYDYEL